MSHIIYTTEGFILKSVNFGEANKYYFIFTAEFGLIKATAQGIRHLKSKLRYHLGDFSFCQISLVRGREVWRITSVEKNLSISDSKKVLLLSRIYSLLLRLLHGEEKNLDLFESLKQGYNFLAKNEATEDFQINFECILALRVLSTLGYLGKIGDFNQFTSSPYFTPELLLTMANLKSQVIVEINKSLKETHL